MRALARDAPGQRVDLPLDRTAEEPMPRGNELDLVDPPPVAVMSVKDGQVSLRPPGVLERDLRAGHGARLVRTGNAPAAALPLQRLGQGQVDPEQVGRLK